MSTDLLTESTIRWPRASPQMAPALTVVIPTINRPRYIIRTVRQVLEQSFQNFDLLVVDQSEPIAASEIATFIAALEDPRISYLHLTSAGVANARNEGVCRSLSEVILFLDDDVILLTPDFFTAHISRFTDPSIGAVSGRIIERRNLPNTRRTVCRVSLGGRTIDNMSGTERVFLEGLKGGNMSIRTEIFRTIGGFDRNFSGTGLLEEADFSTRVRAAGWTLAFEPEAELLHLSAAVGGNRVTSEQERECWRFRSTAYYIMKHRGPIGMLPFLATFGFIAAHRAVRWRSARALFLLLGGIATGLDALQRGADETLPANIGAIARNLLSG
ncbi:MAG: glycosyltransferase family 2 protein [Acetobacteraceae bacterium]|nr:glycosyltransferase family 2 protein [Acetobacteraceae bacterium]